MNKQSLCLLIFKLIDKLFGILIVNEAVEEYFNDLFCDYLEENAHDFVNENPRERSYEI